MGASYADTFAYDLVVVFFVASLMPTSVLLLRSRSGAGKMGGAALLALSVLYVGGFEHYRLHAPEARCARAQRRGARSCAASARQSAGTVRCVRRACSRQSR